MALSPSKSNSLNTQTSAITESDITSKRSFNGSFGTAIHRSNFNAPFTATSNEFVFDADAEDEAMESVQIIFDDELAEVASKTKKPTTNGYKTHSEIEIEVGLDSGNEFEEIIEDDSESVSSCCESEDIPVTKRRWTVSSSHTTPAVAAENEGIVKRPTDELLQELAAFRWVQKYILSNHQTKSHFEKKSGTELFV
ncbi:hypothetical protein HK100_002445 [Physocladia obscura]|uniref:Uncharacterized protein n=1 Tax=Physocladia obscura TaxID=109957 RepID=A0AAD5SVD7_9FUNG|nr:hypothetical protein HK100_002445 [Physocladia obscura]